VRESEGYVSFLGCLGLDINEPDALPGSLTHAKNQGVFDGCDQRKPESDKYPESFFS